MNAPQAYLDIKSEHGEGPIWDHINQILYWVDIHQGLYNKVDFKTAQIEQFNVGQMLGVLGLCTNDQLILGLENGIALWKESTQSLEMIKDFPQDNDTDIRFNDGAVSPDGHFFAGTMAMDGDKDTGLLFRMKSDLKYQVVRDKMYIPNGMGWNMERSKYFVTDSVTQTIYSYDYELGTGKISNPKPHISFSGEEFPDGMCMDENDCFWVAVWGGSKVVQFDPAGKAMREIPVPFPNPTSCCFGGPDRKTLFITSSHYPLSEAQKREFPMAGRTLFLETESTGQIEPRFKI